MNMSPSSLARSLPAVTDVYTDVHGLEKLKTEKNQDVALRKVAQQFESLFVNMMMKSMRDANAVFEEGSPFSSSETQFYRDMYDQQLSLSLAHNKGVGIADALYRQMRQRYGEGVERFVPGHKKSSETPVSDVSLNKSEKNTSGKNIKEFRSPQDFINEIMPMVEKAAKKIGIDSEMIVAQAALETGWGKHIIKDSSGSSFNLFNIKADSRWQGESVDTQTQEFQFGKMVTQTSAFRKYASFEESINDYVEFLSTNPRYKDALSTTDSSKAFIQKIQESGYATDPNYASKVSSVYSRIIGDSVNSGRETL